MPPKFRLRHAESKYPEVSARLVAAEPSPPAVLPDLCVVALKYVRLERELADVQRELNRLQNMGDTGAAAMPLLARKQLMVRALEAMKPPKELQ